MFKRGCFGDQQRDRIAGRPRRSLRQRLLLILDLFNRRGADWLRLDWLSGRLGLSGLRIIT